MARATIARRELLPRASLHYMYISPLRYGDATRACLTAHASFWLGSWRGCAAIDWSMNCFFKLPPKRRLFSIETNL